MKRMSNVQAIYETEGTFYNTIFEKKTATITAIADRISDLNNGSFSPMNMTRYEIAVGLFRVQTEKLYEVVPRWNNVYEFAGEVLHFKKMTTSNYIRVARYYLHHDKPLNIFENDRFSITQLTEMCKAPVEDVKKLVEDKVIRPDMTVVAIREVITKHNEAKKATEEELKAQALEPIKQAHEDFHKAYNELKAHLLEEGDDIGANDILPVIMDAVVRMYNAKLEVDLPVL